MDTKEFDLINDKKSMNIRDVKIIFRATVDLRAELKKLAADRNTTMSLYILRAIYKQIREDKAHE